MSSSEKTQGPSGGEKPPERFMDRHLGNAIHLFLSLLAVLFLLPLRLRQLKLSFAISQDSGGGEVSMTR